MQGKKEDMTNEQSAKKRRVSVAVRKELLSLRHRFGERTSCEGRLTTQFRLVNSGKILSRDERRQMSTPYCYRAWTAFPHFLIRFTRAIQRNEKGWDALFLYALAVAPLRVFDPLRVFARNKAIQKENDLKLKWIIRRKNIDKLSISLKNDYICSELGEKSWLGKEGILIVPNYEIANFMLRGTRTNAHFLFLLSTRCVKHLIEIKTSVGYLLLQFIS